MKTQNQIRSAVSENILRFKADEKMTYDDISEITGIQKRSLKYWARCENAPSLYNAYLLSNAMGMTLNELIE